MRPYGRVRNTKGFRGKIDHHLHKKNRKVGSWWEDYSEKNYSRTTIKRMWKNESEKDNSRD